MFKLKLKTNIKMPNVYSVVIIHKPLFLALISRFTFKCTVFLRINNVSYCFFVKYFLQEKQFGL